MIHNSIDKKWFTLVELIISATIIIILTTIGFYSYTESLGNARDWVRKSDLITLESQLNSHKNTFWSFPIPWDWFEIHNRWYHVATQWVLDRNVWLEGATNLPTDPLLDRPYVYSTTRNRQEFQIAATLENDDINIALIRGNYTSVSKNILPTIVLALESISPIEVNASVWNGGTNRDAFVFDRNALNLPYSLEDWNPINDGEFILLLLRAEGDTFWQSSSYRDCVEIFNASKHITPNGSTDQYQVRNETWVLVDRNCSCTDTICNNVF